MPFRPLLAAVLGACLCMSALASERRYDVEIVILENTDARAGESEGWRPEVVVPEIGDAVAPAASDDLAPMVRVDRLAELPEGFEPLPPERRRLQGAIDRLQESGQYRVLRHLAWQQPALGEGEAPSIRVHDGAPLTVRLPIESFDQLDALESGAADASASGDAAPADAATEEDRQDRTAEEGVGVRTFGAESGLDARMQPLLRPVEIHPLDGTIRLVVSRYLHVYTDLYFTTPVEWTEPATTAPGTAPDAPGGDESQEDEADPNSGIDTTPVASDAEGRAMLSYPFVQHRRMRSGELHYLDHPVLGMLIRVDRAEEDAAGEDAGADAAD